MKRWFTLGIIMLVIPLTSYTQRLQENTPSKTVDLMKGISPTLTVQPIVPASTATLAAFDRFALELLRESLPAEHNLLISPLSVHLALGMTLNGARGNTALEMLSTLGDSKLGIQDINTASRYWLNSITTKDKNTTVSIANSVWFDQRYSPSTEFLQTNANYFTAGVRKLDFADAGTLAVINKWVSDATEGTIQKIVERLEPDALMVLINTVYFLSDWAAPFDPGETYDRTFYTPDGEITTAFMSKLGRVAYLKGQDAKGIALPYANPRFVFFALMPNDRSGLQEWLDDRKPQTFLRDIRNLVANPTFTRVDLSIPKFEASYEDSLVNELGRMGMSEAFQASMADFSGMSAQATKDLYIGDVIHKTYIRVDEKGTEAAAATAVVMVATAMAFDGITLVFDRPFCYGILDIATGLPLFLGLMEYPEEP